MICPSYTHAGWRPQCQYSSSEFILAAGAVPFQFDAAGVPKRVLLIHHSASNAWFLAKGRKDEGEDLATTATREIFEETGYPCRLYPIPRLSTCAPIPAELAGIGLQPQSARIANNSTEPFMITLRALGHRQMKLIFWYIGAVDPGSPAVQHGSHQVEEGLDDVRLFDIGEALKMLAFEGDRDILRTAVRILTSTT